MGGWIRIWVVLTVAAGAFSGLVYVDNIRNAERQANDAYKNALDNYDACRQAPPQPKTGVSSSQAAAGDTGPISDLLSTLQSALIETETCPGTEQSREQYAKLQGQQRDDAIATAERGAAGKAALTVVWVSGTVGTLFLAVGWVWRGFRRKKLR